MPPFSDITDEVLAYVSPAVPCSYQPSFSIFLNNASTEFTDHCFCSNPLHYKAV